MEASKVSGTGVGVPYCAGYNYLYIKANGDVRCWCGSGERVVLGSLLSGSIEDFVSDVVNGPLQRRIRRAFLKGSVPFDECRVCELFSWNVPLDAWSELSDTDTCRVRGLGILQVEPSFLCTLDCPMCVRKGERPAVQRPPYVLPVEVFQRLVADLAVHTMPVREFSFCGRGEPFLNPHLLDLVRWIKDRLDTRVTIITNGNFDFDSGIVTSGLDRIEISWDGTTPGSYRKYRINGNFDQVVRLTADISRYKRANALSRPWLVLKYILFSWNDSLEELHGLAEMADALEVDEILFVCTDTLGRSRRYSPESIRNLLSGDLVRDRVHFPKVRTLQAKSALGLGRFLYGWRLILDTALDSLKIEGWFLDSQETERMRAGRIYLDGEALGGLRPNLPSWDLVRKHHCEAVWSVDPCIRFEGFLPLQLLKEDSKAVSLRIRTTENRLLHLGERDIAGGGIS